MPEAEPHPQIESWSGAGFHQPATTSYGPLRSSPPFILGAAAAVAAWFSLMQALSTTRATRVRPLPMRSNPILPPDSVEWASNEARFADRELGARDRVLPERG